MSQAQFARHIGVTPGYVSELKRSGRLVMVDELVDVQRSIDRIDATKKHPGSSSRIMPRSDLPPEQPRTAPSPSSTADDASPDYQHARALREHYNALTAKAEYEERIRQLLPIGDARRFVTDACTIIRAGLESLPETLAPQLAAESDEHIVQSVMAAHVERLLQEMADKFSAWLS